MCRVEGSQGGSRCTAQCVLYPDTETEPASEAAYSISTFLERENLQVFLEKTKVKWKTDLSFLECLKEDNT